MTATTETATDTCTRREHQHEPYDTITRLQGEADRLRRDRDAHRDAALMLARALKSITDDAVRMVGTTEHVTPDGDGDWSALWEQLDHLAAIGRAHGGDRLRALALHDQGLTVRAIADQIDRAPSTVHMWIKEARA